jgi:hypothetical protein
MATKDDFTEDEWQALQQGLLGSGMLVSLSDPDFTDMFGEASAITKYLSEQRESDAGELVRELAEVRGKGGFGFTDSRSEVEAETLAALGTAKEALAAKAPAELDAYRTLVLGLAERTATAKSGVEASETEAIDKIRQALD